MSEWFYIVPEKEKVEKHLGPDLHPSGSPQSAHAGGRKGAKLTEDAGTKSAKITAGVNEVKGKLAKEDEDILAVRGSPETWASQFMDDPKDLDWKEFDKLTIRVGRQLVKDGVLKPDKRKREGVPRSRQIGYRVSRGWWNKQQK